MSWSVHRCFGLGSLLTNLLLQSLLALGDLQASVLLPTCMSGQQLLIEAVRCAIATLRLTADGLELALNRITPGSRPPARVEAETATSAPSWDLLTVPEESSSQPDLPRPVFLPAPLTPSSQSFDSYHEVSSGIGPVPDHCVDFCSRLGSAEEARRRATRAWEAGRWARAALEGIIPKPRPTPKIHLRPCVYLIVRAPGIENPVRVASANEYFRLLPVFTQDSISHSFPSIAEARCYCAGVGIPLPDQQ